MFRHGDPLEHDRPMSRAAFEARFPDEAACARHLAAKRWPDGFVCPACGHDRGWELKRRRASWECAACGKETSVTAGTIMHRSHLPLKTWLMAVHIVTSHSNGISALQLQAQLGLGSYKSAWLLLHKLRRAMVDPDRSLLEDLVEIDEATLPFRTAKDPTTGGQGRSRQGKMRIAGAVELSPEGEPRRIRLAPIGDFSARSLQVVGATPAHLVLIWIHRVDRRGILTPDWGNRRPKLPPPMVCSHERTLSLDGRGEGEMLVVETIAKIRRDHLVRGVPIKTIARDLRVSKNTVRKVVRGDETSYSYERKIQPMPKLGPWVDELERQLKANEKKARRDRLSLLRIHEDLASLGYEGGYDAVRRYARVWRRRHRLLSSSEAYVPLIFDPGEAYQFDWSHEYAVLSGTTTRVKAAHMRL